MAHPYYTPVNQPSSISTPLQFEHWQPPQTAQTPASSTQKESFLPGFENAEPSSSLFRPSKRSIVIAAISFFWRTIFLHIAAIAYLAFCYTCHFKFVRVPGVLNPTAHLDIIKSGVTSVCIVLVSLSLLPLYALISDLKGEEFFRALSSKRSGVPLSTINRISTPSYGARDGLVTSLRRQTSAYFMSALLASLVALAVSTLAPASLAVDTILFDGDLVAFPVGAINRNSILNTGDLLTPYSIDLTNSALNRYPEGGAVASAEFFLGVNYSFQSPHMDQTYYIVPAPLTLSTSTRGRWISDVALIQPSCEWLAPQFPPTGVNLTLMDMNSTAQVAAGPIVMNITSQNIQVSMSTGDIYDGFKNFTFTPLRGSWFSNAQLQGEGSFSASSVLDLQTMDDLSNGATIWVLRQCVAGCPPSIGDPDDEPIEVTFPSEMKSSRYNGSDGITADVALLYCTPNSQIETRLISNDGRGTLTIGDVSTLQGNLHPIQTNLMMSFAFNRFDVAGPQTAINISSLGNELQLSFIFGKNATATKQFTPQSISNITASYAKILQSAAKSFMDGSLATSFVPGRLTEEIVVFKASLPHIIASTVLYLALSAFVFVCYFRRHVPQFTLFAVAASLEGSEITPLFAQLKDSQRGTDLDNDSIPELKNARVLLEQGRVLTLRQ